MKRPQGFDVPTEAPPVSRAKKKSSAPPVAQQAAAQKAQGATRQKTPRGTAHTVNGDSPAGPNAAGARTGEPLAPVLPLWRPSSGPEASDAQHDDRRGGATRRAGQEARAARRHARAATRDRRRYERDEVRRFTLRSRRRRTIWTVCLGAVALLVAFVLIGAFSPLMALHTIDVQGADRISEDDIVQALDGQLGRPLTLIDYGEVEQVLGTFPLIRSYSTEASPPNTLILRIIERTPVAVLKVADDFQLVDQAKVVIEQTPKRPEGYPLITTAEKDGDDTGFTAAIAVIDALPGQLRKTVDTVTAGTRDDVTLMLAGGARVVWGSADDSELKAVVLEQLMKNNDPKSVTEFDVSSPESAVVR